MSIDIPPELSEVFHEELIEPQISQEEVTAIVSMIEAHASNLSEPFDEITEETISLLPYEVVRTMSIEAQVIIKLVSTGYTAFDQSNYSCYMLFFEEFYRISFTQHRYTFSFRQRVAHSDEDNDIEIEIMMRIHMMSDEEVDSIVKTYDRSNRNSVVFNVIRLSQTYIITDDLFRYLLNIRDSIFSRTSSLIREIGERFQSPEWINFYIEFVNPSSQLDKEIICPYILPMIADNNIHRVLFGMIKERINLSPSQELLDFFIRAFSVVEYRPIIGDALSLLSSTITKFDIDLASQLTETEFVSMLVSNLPMKVVYKIATIIAFFDSQELSKVDYPFKEVVEFATLIKNNDVSVLSFDIAQLLQYGRAVDHDVWLKDMFMFLFMHEQEAIESEVLLNIIKLLLNMNIFLEDNLDVAKIAAMILIKNGIGIPQELAEIMIENGLPLAISLVIISGDGVIQSEDDAQEDAQGES